MALVLVTQQKPAHVEKKKVSNRFDPAVNKGGKSVDRLVDAPLVMHVLSMAHGILNLTNSMRWINIFIAPKAYFELSM